MSITASYSYSSPTDQIIQNHSFAICMAIAVFGYLLPWHSPLGRDFLVNAFSFVFICAGIANFLWWQRIQQVSIAIVTWLALALWLLVQPLLVDVRYPDALLFPIGGLVVVALTTLVASNIQDKRSLLQRLFVGVYIMAMISFLIQLLQISGNQLDWHGWVIARGNANMARFDGNFGQANHAGYAFVLALCGVIYLLYDSYYGKESQALINPNVPISNTPMTLVDRLQRLKWARYYRFVLMLSFIIFTIALALTQSRAGLIMMIAVITIFFISQPIAWRRKLSLAGFSGAVFLMYYVAASWVGSLAAGATGNSLGAVSRLAGGEGNRRALSERAMLIFHDHPLTGVGWNNYMGESVNYAQHFKWPEIADHSHNFVTMILAEMGIIGLLCCLPIIWLLLRAIHMRHSSESAISLAFVVASLLYSSVEYPLWYFRYLAVFALFLALIEQRYLAVHWLSTRPRRLLAAAMATAIGVAAFYTSVYFERNYLDYNQFVTHQNQLFNDSQIRYNGGIFGFTPYHERILSMQVPVNRYQLDKKLDLFYNAIDLDSSQFNILSYAQLLAYKGENAEALTHIKAACIMVRDVKDCENVDKDLHRLAQNDPKTFANLYEQFVAWRQANPIKTGLTS